MNHRLFSRFRAGMHPLAGRPISLITLAAALLSGCSGSSDGDDVVGVSGGAEGNGQTGGAASLAAGGSDQAAGGGQSIVATGGQPNTGVGGALIASTGGQTVVAATGGQSTLPSGGQPATGGRSATGGQLSVGSGGVVVTGGTGPTGGTVAASGGSSPTGGSPGAAGCTDTATDDGVSCAQWLEWAECSSAWMVDNHLCDATCGRCEAGSGGANGTGGTPSTGGTNTGGVVTGGTATGGTATGGTNTGGVATGGTATGGMATGGTATGGMATGGTNTGGEATGGTSTGGQASTVGKFIGNITTGWQGALDVEGRIYSDHWDQVTPENAGKWGSVQSTASSSPNWSTLDAIYDYTEQKGILFKQHTFVWGNQQPTGTITESDVRNWIQSFCSRYPNTRLIDVVNEPPPHTEPAYAGAIGGGTDTSWQWIINAFTWARESCPGATLILNDYNNIEWSDQTQHFIDIANAVQAAGGPIDAVGAQAHGLSSTVSTATMISLITKLHNDTGLPVYVTEYDINLDDDSAQLAKYQEHFEFFLTTEWIAGITVWGWVYGQTWMDYTGLIRNGTARPALTWLMDRLGRPAP